MATSTEEGALGGGLLSGVAVLSMSDIWTWQDVLPEGEAKDVYPDGRFIVSRGRLERALREGLEVFVVSTRSALSDYDAWWRLLVPPEHVLLGGDGAETCSVSERNASRGAGWVALYRCLGLAYPHRMDGAPEPWTEARAVLGEMGARLGHSLEGAAEVAAHKRVQQGIRARSARQQRQRDCGRAPDALSGSAA